MSRLSDLESKLSRLKNQKKSLESNLKTYNARKKDVEKIRDKLVDVADSNYDDVNKFINKICDDAAGGVKGTSFGTNVYDSVNRSKEKSSGGDKNVTTALSDLRSELSNINKKIGNWESELADVKRQIDNTEQDIREERKREAEETVKKVLDKIF